MNNLWRFLTNTTFYTIFNQNFEKNNSTEFCLFYLADKISEGFDSGVLTGVILIDF